MGEEYNWELIIKIAALPALIEAYIFYTNISNAWKWFLLIAGLIITGSITYYMDKKKTNIFTAVGIVFLSALIVRFMKIVGFF